MEVVLRPYHSDGRVFKFSLAGSFALPSFIIIDKTFLPGKCLFVRIVVESIFLTNIIGHKCPSWPLELPKAPFISLPFC